MPVLKPAEPLICRDWIAEWAREHERERVRRKIRRTTIVREDQEGDDPGDEWWRGARELRTAILAALDTGVHGLTGTAPGPSGAASEAPG